MNLYSPKEMLGKTIYFIDYISCIQCPKLHQDIESCPSYDSREECPLFINEIIISELIYTSYEGQLICTINDDYEFSESEFDKIFLSKEAARAAFIRQENK